MLFDSHMNPLKRPKEWPSSRVSFYSKFKQNFIRIDLSAELRITEGKTKPGDPSKTTRSRVPESPITTQRCATRRFVG